MNPIQEYQRPTPPGSSTASLTERELESHGFYLMPLLHPGFEVLDIGCGPATITAGIADMVFPGRVTALDVAPSELETGRRLTEGREIMNIDFVAGCASRLPFADHSFDVIFANALLEHLPDPQAAMKEFHRVTRPGGFIAVCSPDWNRTSMHPDLAWAINAYRHLQERRGARIDTGAHLRHWLESAQFTPLVHDEWIEECENPAERAEGLARELEDAGQFHHATALREWAMGPSLRFRQSWFYATAVRTDDYSITKGSSHW